jgi:autotransporter family porin
VHLELRDVIIRDANDTAGGLGGAVQNIQGGVVSISGSAFIDDEANADGGAIDNADLDGTGTLTVAGSTFSNNFAVNGDGGAIANADLGGTDQVSVIGSSFLDNGALSGDGGAIDNGDTRGNGTLHVTGCLFEQNAAGRAGAIDNGDNATGTLTVASSSFITNVAASGDAGAVDNADWGDRGPPTSPGPPSRATTP